MNVRGLNLGMLDAESKLENKELVDWAIEYMAELIEQGTKQRKILEYWDYSREDTPNRCLEYERNTLLWLRDKYSILKGIVDSLKPGVDAAESYFEQTEKEATDDPDDNPEEPGYNITHWKAVWNEWDTIYGWILDHHKRMSLGYWAFIYDLLETKLKRKEITMYHFCKVGSFLANKLGWKQEICRMAKLSKKLKGKPAQPGKPKNVVVSYEDRFYGEMSYSENDLIRAIDTRDAAARCGCSVYDFEDDF